MLVLLGIGLLAGLVTALSPCVLPVLPILLAGGASGGRRRPYAIIAGLVASFTVFTLAASALLDLVGLPQDFLRNVAIALLFLVAATLFVPQLGHWLERPFYVLTRRRGGDAGGGFVLGLSLGLVFVPCAGPVLAAMTVLAANRRVGLDAVVLTLAYALGAAIPMLAIALGGRRIASGLRARMTWLRPALGAVVALTALAIAFGFDQRFQTAVPGYTEALQERFERSAAAERELQRITGRKDAPEREETEGDGGLRDFGPAPELQGLTEWLNTPRGEALSLASLRGRVVVIDFWTYSCVNCLRTFPYLKAWDATYRDDGLTIIGVHAPEFAFERVPANVRTAVERHGLRYPVALDNGFETWSAYSNQYWPAKYFIDRGGHVRFAHFGEGEYEQSEEVIRTLLAEKGETPTGRAKTPSAPVRVGEITPETYLGWERLERYDGPLGVRDRPFLYRFRSEPPARNHFSLSGRWTVEAERSLAVAPARLRLHFSAREVNLVMSGRGTVGVQLDGQRLPPVTVDGARLYTLFRLAAVRDGVLELSVPAGVAGYAFTFG